MFYKIEKINWDNNDEIEFCNKTNSWNIIFTLDEVKKRKQNKAHIAFIAKDESNNLIWRINSCLYDEDDSKDFWIEWISKNEPRIFWLFVQENYRNNWIWKSLVNELIKYFKENWFNYLCLDTINTWKYYEKNWWFKYSHKIKRLSPAINKILDLEIYYLDLKNA